MSAPDKIWAVHEEDFSAQTSSIYAQSEPEGFIDTPTPYIRKDLHDTLSAANEEQAARIVALEAFVEKVDWADGVEITNAGLLELCLQVQKGLTALKGDTHG